MSMVYAVRLHEHGGPDVLRHEAVDVGAPGPDEILIRQSAAGLNFIDTYQRSGLYKVELPFIPGTEGAGTVEAVGSNVKTIKIGERVAYAGRAGGYAQKRLMEASRVVKIPDSIPDEIAAAAMVKGLTAEYLLRRTYPVKAGQTILVHAAAGGVGLIMCQWAKYLGASVIGTVGSDEKAEMARQNGCAHTIIYSRENIVQRVREITNGAGVPVAYDSVGASTFEASLDCLSPRGMMVSFGNASGPVPDFAPLLLSQKGSLYITRPSLWHYIMDVAEYQAAAQALFDVITGGHVQISLNQRYALKDAAQAHTDLEARRTTGSTVLIP
jgi:NADPH:quinone reductase